MPVVRNINTILDDPDHTLVRDRRGKYQATLGLIGKALGTKGIGMNLTVVPPHSAAFPKHYHFVADEAFVILEGHGTLHRGEESEALAPMDVVYVQGGTGIPFQIENTSDAELRYLALSTMEEADVFHYPESGKYGVMARGVPFRDLSDGAGLPRFMRFLPGDVEVDYYHNDPNAD